MKKSEILRIIREKVEVMLTNEEAVEMFDLDPAELLDEMMNEEDRLDEKDRPGGIPFSKLKKGTCTPWEEKGTPDCPKDSSQYNLAKAFKGKIRQSNLKRGKNPHGPG